MSGSSIDRRRLRQSVHRFEWNIRVPPIAPGESRVSRGRQIWGTVDFHSASLGIKSIDILKDDARN